VPGLDAVTDVGQPAGRSSVQFQPGAEVYGEVGDPNPAKAVEDALSRRNYEEIILSILPSGVGRWLKAGSTSQGATHVQGPGHGRHSDTLGRRGAAQE
jgi:hypothetical protein